ncbi:MAG: gephyrin-like molybdotransferase Glp [Ginsengibacter sp.]
MISVSEAKAIITKSISPLAPVELPLTEVANHVLAQDVFATIDIPAFEQSSMDGYAIRFADKNSSLKITGEIAAGSSENLFIQTGEAARIFTGAPLPGGADTVVMQEKIVNQNNQLFFTDESLKQGNNVRHKGAEIKAGSLAVKQGCYLSPAAIGFLAGIGVSKIFVYPMPVVSIIVTGKELQTPGKALSVGQVYESNSYSLRAALQQAGIKTVHVFEADDDLNTLKNILKDALAKSDVVLLTGGVSVGDYDFVIEATKQCDVEQGFHKVKQRPGKPLYFGMKNLKPVFGLPGNPSSVLSCFYNYVLPALEKLSCKNSSIKKVSALLTKNYNKPAGLTHFLKGHFVNGNVMPLGAQESFRLSSFAQANCLICLEEERVDCKAGETAEVYLLPGFN